MGFLRKEWDFENPAEHDMDAHDAYRDEGPKEVGKPWLWGLELVCGCFSVYALYYVENIMYAGAVDTSWAGWSGALIGTFIGLRMGREDADKKWSKKQKTLVWGIIAALIIGYLLFARNRPHTWIVVSQFIVLLLLALVADPVLKKKMDRKTANAWSFLLMPVCIAAVTFAAPKVLGMTSVAEGEELLRLEGYQGVYFKTKTMPHWLGEEMMTEALAKMPIAIENEFVYLYGGVKDDISYGILVDPYGRGILAEQESLPGTKVYDWLH